jgi:hypothetical protein
MKTKAILLVSLAAGVLSSCQPAMPAVPPSNRTVVQPKGSSESVKAWSMPTRKEGEAVLGPLGDMNRR